MVSCFSKFVCEFSGHPVFGVKTTIEIKVSERSTTSHFFQIKIVHFRVVWFNWYICKKRQKKYTLFFLSAKGTWGGGQSLALFFMPSLKKVQMVSSFWNIGGIKLAQLSWFLARNFYCRKFHSWDYSTWFCIYKRHVYTFAFGVYNSR